jgi:hypothetical protein
LQILAFVILFGSEMIWEIFIPTALAIARDDFIAADLREAVRRSNDADATRRMLALALVLEGFGLRSR